MNNETMVLDSTAVAWYENQLRVHEAKAYDRKTPALMAREVFPVDSTSNPYAKSLSFMSFDNVGEAKILADGSLDAPMGDIAGSETAYPVVAIATAWDMSNWEIEAARKTGVDIESRHVNAAFDRVNRKINELAFAGSTARNVPGLGNDSDITPVAATHGGWVAGASASNALDDIVVAYAAHQDACSGAHDVTDILLPIKEYNWLATTKNGTYSDLTILQWLAQNLPFIGSVANFHKVPEMKNFYSTNECFTLYNKSPECLELKITQEISYSAPLNLGLGMRTFCTARCGGLHIHYPKSVYVTYGV